MNCEICSIVGSGQDKFGDAVNWICKKDDTWETAQDEDDTVYIGGENSAEVEFDDIGIFADAAEALGWNMESWACQECGHSIEQYAIGDGMLFNGNEGDGWQFLPYEMLPEEKMCNYCK